MNKGILGLGAGTTAMAVLAVLSLSAPTTAHAGVCNATASPDFGNPALLQAEVDAITVGGSSSVNTSTDCLGDGADALWQIGATGGSHTTIVVEIAGFAGSNTFGIWDAANPANRVQIFSGADSSGDDALFSILADGSVRLNFVDTGIDFAGNKFGFYLDSPAGLFFSDTSLNADQTDHMYAYQGQGDTIQVLPFAPGPWDPNTWLLAWEDLFGGGDKDFRDFVVLVESVSPVPEPSTVAILGLGLLALGAANRRRTRRVRG